MVTSNRQAGHKANTSMVVGKVQNHRMGVVGRGLWRLSCPLTLLRQSHLEQGAGNKKVIVQITSMDEQSNPNYT